VSLGRQRDGDGSLGAFGSSASAATTGNCSRADAKRCLSSVLLPARALRPALRARRIDAEHFVAALNGLTAQRPWPKALFVYYGAEFADRSLGLPGYHHKAEAGFSHPGKPTDNVFVESFYRSLRDEYLSLPKASKPFKTLSPGKFLTRFGV